MLPLMARASQAAVAAAFEAYCSLGPTRSLHRLASSGIGWSIDTLRRWSAKYGWVEAAAMRDLEQARRLDPVRLSVGMELIERIRRAIDVPIETAADLRNVVSAASMLLPAPQSTPWQAEAKPGVTAEAVAEVRRLVEAHAESP